MYVLSIDSCKNCPFSNEVEGVVDIICKIQNKVYPTVNFKTYFEKKISDNCPLKGKQPALLFVKE